MGWKHLLLWVWLAGWIGACADSDQTCTYDTDCPSTLVCDNGVCRDPCNQVNCPAGQVCQDGKCVTPPCTATSCNSPPGEPVCYDLPAPCEAGNCRYEPVLDRGCDDTVACTTADRCRQLGQCAGDPLPCDDPPPSRCLDDQRLQVFTSPGTCDGGTCDYPSVEVTCPQDCLDGVCLGCTPEWVEVTGCDCTPGPCVGCSGNLLESDGCGQLRQVACSPPAAGCDGICCQDTCCPAGSVCQGANCCQPQCAARECGPDSCGGVCGDCPAQFACQADGSCRLESTCPAAGLPPATAFGFDYAPVGRLGRWVAGEYPLVEAEFGRDLVIMASLGTRVVRIMLLPYTLGMRIEADGGPGNWDTVELDALSANLPLVLQRLAEHGMAAVLSFGPNAYYWNGPASGGTWWEYTYGPGGWSAFVADLVAWSTEVVEAVETSPACTTVLYYDLHNEVDYRVPGMPELVRGQLSGIPVPDEKRGLSLLEATRAGDLAADLAAAGHDLRFAEFHPYPDRGANADVAAASDAVRAALPGVDVLAGEFAGIYCENGQSEAAQAATVSAVLNAAGAAGLRAALNWMLWDRAPDTTCDGDDRERTGLGFEADLPRDAWDAVAGRQGLVDGTFEAGLSGWYVGGADPSTVFLERGGPSATDAASGLYYGRLRAIAPGPVWLCSPMAPVTAPRLAVSGYVRSSTTALTLGINCYDGAAVHLGQVEHPFTIPAGWAFSQLQARLGGVVSDLPPGTASVIVCLGLIAPAGTGSTSPAYLDLDGMAFRDFAPL